MASSTQRLASLPGIFTASDALLRANVAAGQLNQVLWRWKCAGYVKPLGARSDVWFNLVVDPVITRERWEKALRRALPTAIVAGHGVLMRSGVTTQLSNSDYLIQPARSPSTSIEGVALHERPVLWIRKLRKLRAINTEHRLPELDPGAALADLVAFDPSSIELDEIDWDEMTPESLALFNELLQGVELQGQDLSSLLNARRNNSFVPGDRS